MQLKSNLEEVIKRLKELSEKSASLDFSEALTAGVNAARAALDFRVFNTGKDAKGVPFGKYMGKRSRVTNRKYRVLRYEGDETKKEKKKQRKGIANNASKKDSYTEYEKFRLSHGRQVKYKDLEFTGTLRRSIVIARVSNTRVTVIINNPKTAKIAQYQQEQISKILGVKVNIWGLSEEERDLMETIINQALKELYARLFNS